MCENKSLSSHLQRESSQILEHYLKINQIIFHGFKHGDPDRTIELQVTTCKWNKIPVKSLLSTNKRDQRNLINKNSKKFNLWKSEINTVTADQESSVFIQQRTK